MSYRYEIRRAEEVECELNLLLLVMWSWTVVCWNMIFEFNIAHLGNIDAIREKQAAGYFLAATRLLFYTPDSFCFLTFPTTSLPLQPEMCVGCGPQIE